MRLRRLSYVVLASTAIASIVALAPRAEGARVRFAVTYGPDKSAAPLDGRLLAAALDRQRARSPALQISDNAPQDPAGLRHRRRRLEAGRARRSSTATSSAIPAESLADIPAGTYSVQALLHRYETFRRADGHVVKLPMDRGEGQQWSQAPGNLYSTPREIAIDPARREPIAHRARPGDPADPRPADTKYIKHERIQSERLTKFWGRPMYLGAHVLLPEGFDEHPEARYPLVINHGHFPYTIDGFREEPPDPNLKPEYSDRFHLDGLQPHRSRSRRTSSTRTGPRPDFPRFLRDRDPAREPVLRRLLRGELGEPRPLRRRDHRTS